MTTQQPALSVVLVTPDRYSKIRMTVRHLLEQTIVRRIELVLVCPSRPALGHIDADLSMFAAHQILEVDKFVSLAPPRAAGVRAAVAPIVAIAEDHCFPRPTWAEALLAAHEGPWVAVGPALENANPGAVSWAQMFLTYGPFVAPGRSGVVPDLPGHNSSYKKAALLEYGPALEAMFDVEPFMHVDLRARGYQLYMEAAARAVHVNISRPRSFLVEHFILGQKFAATRCEHWSWLKRIGYAAATPIVGPVQHVRVALLNVWRSGVDRRLIVATLPTLCAGAVSRCIGEIRGLLFGVGSSAIDTLEFEVHRPRHISARDRERCALASAD
jgi:hypothetical protein